MFHIEIRERSTEPGPRRRDSTRNGTAEASRAISQGEFGMPSVLLMENASRGSSASAPNRPRSRHVEYHFDSTGRGSNRLGSVAALLKGAAV